jgi:hypothetical protein
MQGNVIGHDFGLKSYSTCDRTPGWWRNEGAMQFGPATPLDESLCDLDRAARALPFFLPQAPDYNLALAVQLFGPMNRTILPAC